MGALERAADRLFGGLALAGVLVLMAAMLVVIADIVARKAAGFSIKGTLDIQQLAQMACVFLVLPFAFLREAHVSVDFVTERLPRRWLAAVRAAAQVVAALLLAAIAWHSLQQASIQVHAGDRSQTLGIPLLWYWLPLVSGVVLSAAAALLLALKQALAALRPQ